MPGVNSNLDISNLPWYDTLFFRNVYLITGLIVINLEFFGMARFYYLWNERIYSAESCTITLFIILCSIQIFKGLKKTADSDPGYILPHR